MKNYKTISGFSLVELSIVLLIAGLAMAAITGGAHLIQAAKLNKVIAEITGYVTATNNFKDKYRAWPGDMPNATSYWGASVTNGNGNEQVSFTVEGLQAWKEMALANLIAGSYTGAVSGTLYAPGINTPVSSLAGGGYEIVYQAASTIYATGGNMIQLGSTTGGNAAGYLDGQIITSADAHVIDVKIDDGLASTGNLYTARSSSLDGTANRCVDAAVATASANYYLTDFAISCRIIYWLNKL